MRNTLIFAGSSCPTLAAQICENLGMTLAPSDLSQFSNGETSVRILKSVREKDVFVVQSGSSKINDTVMELLVLIAALKGGSATKITAVLPYLPYSRQSKKKSHRGAITARLLANLLCVAGVKHIITVDLHASQMQGFFKCPIDNLHAEPLLAHWIRNNVPDWRAAVVVSKNAGGTIRVTSLADALKLSFGIITTDKKRGASLATSTILPGPVGMAHPQNMVGGDKMPAAPGPQSYTVSGPSQAYAPPAARTAATSPLCQLGIVQAAAAEIEAEPQHVDRPVQDITRGRLIQGHIVDDGFDNPYDDDPMTTSYASSFFAAADGALMGCSDDAGAASDEEEDVYQDPRVEQTITLVGDVKNRPVFIVDDMIDKPSSWIAAAETVVKRGRAKKVYCMATHGVFGGDCLQQLQACECIDSIVVTNSFPITHEQHRSASKLVELNLSALLAEAIRRNHHGESISALFQHMSP